MFSSEYMVAISICINNNMTFMVLAHKNIGMAYLYIKFVKI